MRKRLYTLEKPGLKMRLWGVLCFLLLLEVGLVSASVSLGVSPGVLNYDKVLKGGYARREITISTSKVEEVITAVEFEDSAITGWITLEPNTTNFTISQSKPYELAVIVIPPTNAENGNYSGVMHVRTQKLANLGSAMFGSAIKADITVRINVEVTGQEIASCYMGGLEIKDAEVGYPISVYATLSNDGNVMLSPVLELYVWDQMQQSLLLTKAMEDYTILPTLTQRVYYGVQNTLTPGQYWASVKVPQCGFSQLRTFDILNQGEISDKGELVALNSKPWAVAGELVPIIGVFKNTGERPEDVKLKIEIKKGKELVKAIETETLVVLEGETAEFKQYFLADVAGRYEVRGVAYYNKKISFETGTIINVKPAPIKKPNYYMWVIYLVMVLIIVVLVRKIVRERRGIY
jgi:hypothetical protein